MIASTSASSASVNFSPPPGEHLDAVVVKRVVRRRNHQARGEPLAARQMRDGRRRDDARADDGGAGRHRPDREVAFDLLPGLAGVASHQQPNPAPVRRQRLHERHAEPAYGSRVQRRRAGPAADAISPE